MVVCVMEVTFSWSKMFPTKSLFFLEFVFLTISIILDQKSMAYIFSLIGAYSVLLTHAVFTIYLRTDKKTAGTHVRHAVTNGKPVLSGRVRMNEGCRENGRRGNLRRRSVRTQGVSSYVPPFSMSSLGSFIRKQSASKEAAMGSKQKVQSGSKDKVKSDENTSHFATFTRGKSDVLGSGAFKDLYTGVRTVSYDFFNQKVKSRDYTYCKLCIADHCDKLMLSHSKIKANLCVDCRPSKGKNLDFFQCLSRQHKGIKQTYFCGCRDCRDGNMVDCEREPCDFCTEPKNQYHERFFSDSD